MAKTSSLDRIKIAALLLFVAVCVGLSAWSVWDAFSQTAGGSPIGRDYQVTIGDTPEPTNTPWAAEDQAAPGLDGTRQQRRTPTPSATDPFDTD